MLNSLRNEKLQKWLKKRKGRTLLLADALDMEKSHLYKMVNESRLNAQILDLISEKQKEIERQEVECIKRFHYLQRFSKKGNGRVPKLAHELDVHTSKVRRLVHATGDSRYQLIGVGISKVMNAVRVVERGYCRYGTERMNFKTFLTAEIKRKNYTLKGIEELAGLVKEHANHGNHDVAVIFRAVGENKFKVIGLGFDYLLDDMCKSHVCDPSDPHLHAITVAVLNLKKGNEGSVGGLSIFVNSAPCPKCAERVLKNGISKVYCYFEPERIEGMRLLAEKSIPVLKINILDQTVKNINFNYLKPVA